MEAPIPLSTPSEEVSHTPSQADTDILSNSSEERQRQWPEVFDMYIPKFSVDVEYRMRQENLVHLRDGIHLIPSKELKHDILERLAETIYALKAYPTNAEFEAVASALVRAHPCLKEQGSVYGWSSWKNGLKFKMTYLTRESRSQREERSITYEIIQMARMTQALKMLDRSWWTKRKRKNPKWSPHQAEDGANIRSSKE